MRTTHALVLRLLVDRNDPQALRGTVESVADGETHPFTDGETLLRLLREIGMGEASATPCVADASPLLTQPEKE